MFIDTPRRIAETLSFSLRCVDALQDKGLRDVFYLISYKIYNFFQRCVDLAAKNLAGQSLLNELFTDCSKSELMETQDRIFVGWVEALRNPTNPEKYWVIPAGSKLRSSTQPTHFYFLGKTYAVLRDR